MSSEQTAAEVDALLARLPDEQRAALENLRRVIRAAVPQATELVNYGVPAFRLDGRNLVSYGAGKEHCSLYVQSPEVMDAHAHALIDYRTSKGTVHFVPDRPLPDELVRRLVLARVAENQERYSRKR
jgi:uncharacterized protein YdhG (YjbR/CyaY superfamily)